VLVATTGSSLAAEAPSPGCVTVRAESRPFDGIGYSHVAAASNACTQPVQCQRWTDVDPLPQLVELDPDEREDVLFRRGSPASELRAFARCKFSK
jgi:hypothetical protein